MAALIRSVDSFSMQNPHTGAMRYDSTVARIPAAAISVEDAMMLHRMQDRGERIRVHLTMGAHTLPDAPSRNVVAEIVRQRAARRGRRDRRPHRLVGRGRRARWTTAAACVAAWEAVRLMQRLGLHPRRTVRVVLWTNEENGSRGGQGTATRTGPSSAKHVLAIECDNGVFRPLGFRFQGTRRGAAR